MNITLIGCGCGDLTEEARAAIDRAELLIGSERLLSAYAGDKTNIEAVTAEAIMTAIRGASCERVCVLYSGDSGFWSGARLLLPKLGACDVRVLPGISSVQAFASLLLKPWQDWRLCSAHGVDCDPVWELCQGKPVFFLTGGKLTPDVICRELTDAGLGFLEASVGEDLGTPDARLLSGRTDELAVTRFSPLCVLLVEAAPRYPKRAPGIPDPAFRRAEKIPMTKREVRAAILSMLAVGPGDLCWDIGAGTGSVSVELALQCRAVWGVERDEAALALSEENRKTFGAWNLRLVKGEAPEALADLPKPDAAFIGGSGGRLREILRAVHAANPKARVCVAAITLESLHNSYTAMRELGWETEITQLSVSRGRALGGLTMMQAQNPVWLIGGSAP